MKKHNIERLVLEIFGGCNYACYMCPQADNSRQQPFLKSMPFGLFEDILDDAKQYGVEIVNLDGSGEALLNKNIIKYIDAVARRGMKPVIYSNGSLFRNKLMHDIFDAGISLFRISIIGYNRELYKQSMGIDGFDVVLDNTARALDYLATHNYDATLSTYHLTFPENSVQYDIEQYKINVINKLGVEAEIWKPHNWAGNIELNTRTGIATTCGRPFAPDLTVRAGGLGKNYGAVVPCCQTMGASESDSVLGHLNTHTISEVLESTEYQNLLQAHRTDDWSLAPYCEHCDFRIQDDDVLLYTNNKDRIKTDNMRLTSFNLNDFKSNHKK
jgi:uncharacterized Fe-S cluster-containing radical SAM superfamily protein